MRFWLSTAIPVTVFWLPPTSDDKSSCGGLESAIAGVEAKAAAAIITTVIAATRTGLPDPLTETPQIQSPLLFADLCTAEPRPRPLGDFDSRQSPSGSALPYALRPVVPPLATLHQRDAPDNLRFIMKAA